MRGQKGLHAYTASNETNVVPIGAETLGLKVNPAAGKLKEAVKHPIAGLRSGAAGNMSPSVDDVLSCLQKYDEARQDF